MTDISLIIPAYNEGDIIRQTVLRAEEFLSKYFNYYEIIVVDDGSTDDTAVAALLEGRVTLISYSQNKGKGYAVRLGVQAANGKYILFTDADMAYSFDYILKAISLLKEADIVIGSRYVDVAEFNPYPMHRRLISRGFASFVNRTLQMNLSDTQCGFKAFESTAAKIIFGLSRVDDFCFDVELLYIAQQLGYKIVELPVSMQHFDKNTKVKMFRDSAKMFNQVMQIKKDKNYEYQRNDH